MIRKFIKSCFNRKNKKEIFYHIHKVCNIQEEQKWKVGNILDFSEERHNFFTQLSYDYQPKIQVCLDEEKNVYEKIFILDVCLGVLQNKLTGNYEILLNEMFNCIEEYIILLREVAYEQVRKEKFKKLPSRYNCIWLCREKQLDFWKNTIKGEYRIFKVEVNNNYFKSNDKLISEKTDSYFQILEKAEKYWSYNNEEDDEQDEYLYQGKVKILEEIT